VIAVPAKRIDHPTKTLCATALSALILCSGFTAFSTIDGGAAIQPHAGHLVLLPAIEPRNPVLAQAALITPPPVEMAAVDDLGFSDPKSDYYIDPNSELYVDAAGVLRDAAYEIGQGYQPA
jgi:hypothetical protein